MAFPSLTDSDADDVTTWRDLQQRVCSGFSPDSLLIRDTSRRDAHGTKSAAKLQLFLIVQVFLIAYCIACCGFFVLFCNIVLNIYLKILAYADGHSGIVNSVDRSE